jgi:2-succinyl-5-enolpyruvyl-6-hydroxy-3-cyclohexene-1-carboxylate synthase
VLANRGANGIDGVTSTLLGVAAAASSAGAAPALGLIGDLAFLHDLSGLVWGSLETCPAATLVLVDNAGGGIFNFLAYPDQLDETTFERGFATPQSVRLAPLISAFGIPLAEASDMAEFTAAVEAGVASSVFNIVLCRTERRSNVALHRALNAAIVAAVEAVL